MTLVSEDIRSEILRSKMGVAGIGILAVLATVSVVAMATIPLETLQGWNNPGQWIDLPKASMPAWVNLFVPESIPEHKVVRNPEVSVQDAGGVIVTTQRFAVDFEYDDFPNDFAYGFDLAYEGSPLLRMDVLRPDGSQLELLSISLPFSQEGAPYSGRIFSTDESIRKNLQLQSSGLGASSQGGSAEIVVFSDPQGGGVMKGTYTFLVRLYSTDGPVVVDDSVVIVGGKAFGLMGTDELRRDLMVGLLWGTPLALFIGITVSVGSVVFGLVYGVYAAYRGRLTDEAMMRVNDIVYALPALPFLIILAVTISSSVFLMIGFLMIFGWVGVAKISRSMALQVKTRGFVEASVIMGQKNSRIIFRHIIPQLLPYAFASIAISVPAAITTEAGLSFLGLGDPTFPTWGQILHDANTHGAATRGLWWWIVPPGLMIAVTGLAFVFIGNALDTIVNPRLKRE